MSKSKTGTIPDPAPPAPDGDPPIAWRLPTGWSAATPKRSSI